jgi:hypothetical protein
MGMGDQRLFHFVQRVRDSYWTAVALPFEFDTSETHTIVLRILGGLFLIIVLGLAYSLLVSRDLGAAAALLFSGAILAKFGWAVVAHLPGSKGVIRADAVTLEPTRLWGVTFARPAGCRGIGLRQMQRTWLWVGPRGDERFVANRNGSGLLESVIGIHHRR